MLAVSENRAPAARDEAKTFLQQLLADGPMATTDIDDAAKGHGISLRTLRRAKRELKITAKKNGKDGNWTWSLGNQPAPPHWIDDA